MLEELEEIIAEIEEHNQKVLEWCKKYKDNDVLIGTDEGVRLLNDIFEMSRRYAFIHFDLAAMYVKEMTNT